MFNEFEKRYNSVAIEGPAGLLEALLSRPSVEISKPIIGIICHPHPLQEGTMYNKVVTTIAKAFMHQGAWVLTFNFRGVGESEGEYDHARGEVNDLLAVLDWALERVPGTEIWLAGFSFGSYIAAVGATKRKVSKLISIAPPVEYTGFEKLHEIHCPWLVIQGDLDDVISPRATYDWIESRSESIELIRFSDVGHFFHGHLVELREGIEGWLEKV